MEDFYYAGGLPAVLEQIRDRLALDAIDRDRPDARREPRRGPHGDRQRGRDQARLEPARGARVVGDPSRQHLSRMAP